MEKPINAVTPDVATSPAGKDMIDRLREGHYPPKREMMIEELTRSSGYTQKSLELLSDRVITAKYMEMERDEPLKEFAYHIVDSPVAEWIFAQQLDDKLVHSECVVPGLDVALHLLAWTSMRRIEDLCRRKLLDPMDIGVMKQYQPRGTLRLDQGDR